MSFLRRKWWYVCLAFAIISGIVGVFVWKDLAFLQKLALLNFITLLLHEFEEYGWPGGGQAVANTLRPGDIIPDRYPLNQMNAMVGNLFFVLVFYPLPIFFPNVIWLGVAPVVFGLMQVLAHGIITNVRMKSPYNPGMASSVLGHLPIGVLWIGYVTVNHLATGKDWAIGLCYLIVGFGIAYAVLVYKLMADKHTKYPFSSEEMNQFHMYEKAMRTLGKEVKPYTPEDMKDWGK
ncbi:MAG: HXXEE domain-containing protein [Clostridiales bacterium]|nr:HXXEE domain-containing protein [Clostridiales bacterium]